MPQAPTRSSSSSRASNTQSGPCQATEPSPGYFGDTVKTAFDCVAGWLANRFL